MHELRRAMMSYPHGVTELSKRSGVESTSLWAYVYGRHAPNLTTVEKLAPHLGLKLIYDPDSKQNGG